MGRPPARGRRLEGAQEGEHPGGPVDDEVGRGDEVGRRLAGVDGDTHAELQPVEAAECIDVGRVVAGPEGVLALLRSL